MNLGFNYHQTFLEHGYKELVIPPAPGGGFRMEKRALHIWPRGGHMLIALPNFDGSFTCTCFWPLRGRHSFEALQAPAEVEAYFREEFPDAVPLMPTLREDFFQNPTGSLVTIRCDPWHDRDRVVLLGDSCHAVVPFYGQGANAAFEDCVVLDECLRRVGGERGKAFALYQQLRKRNTDALADLSLENFVEMRDKTASRFRRRSDFPRRRLPHPMDGTMELNYAAYLKLAQLLDLQEPRSQPEEHDEMLFIVIHQVYELWFKLLLHELERIKQDFSANDLFRAIAGFKRIRTVMKTLVGQLDILETMTPMSFSGFRDRLETASGFQSVQYRELEFVLGYKRGEVVKGHPAGSPARRKLEARLRDRSVVDHFYDFLAHRGVTIPPEIRDRDVTLGAVADDRVQEGLYRLYREQPDAAILLELMIDFDEGQQEWRYRHVKLTERTIGNKIGTGGSSGVDFLKGTLFKSFFPDLWAIRHRF